MSNKNDEKNKVSEQTNELNSMVDDILSEVDADSSQEPNVDEYGFPVLEEEKQEYIDPDDIKTEDFLNQEGLKEEEDVKVVSEKPAHKPSNAEFLQNLEKKKIDAPLADTDKAEDCSDEGETKVIDFKLSDKYKDKVIPNTDQIDIDEKALSDEEQKELKKKRKDKVKDFVLVRSDEEEPEDEDDEIAEYTEIGQARQILKKLNRFNVTAILRVLVLTVTSAILFYTSFAYDNETLYLPEFLTKANPVGLISFNATLGLISCAVSMPIIIGGLKKLFTLKADEDSICTLAAISSIAVPIYFLIFLKDININNVVLYVSVAVIGLLFNAIGKLVLVNAMKRNFKFVSGTSKKYGIDTVTDDELAEDFTKGSLVDFPQLCVMHETEFLTDFIKTSTENTFTYKIGRITAPVSIIAAIAVAFACRKIYGDVSLALSAFAGTMCVFAPFSLSLLTNIPLSRASSNGIHNCLMLASYDAAQKFADTNSVLLNASDLFPDGTISLVTFKIFGNKKPDEAILYASSLCISSNSVLSHIFYDIISGKVNMLKKVENFVYEDSMGMSAWIDNKRILLGNRDLMKNHGIAIPSLANEKKYIKSDDIKVLYLSISGEVSAVFHIQMKSSLEVGDKLKQLEKNGINIMLKTVDSVITVSNIAEIFNISPNIIRVLPFRLHNSFDKQIRYLPKMPCDAACDGKFSSFASALTASKRIRKTVRMNTAIHVASMILAVVLFATFALLSAVGYFTPSSIIIYYFAWAFIIAVFGLDV